MYLASLKGGRGPDKRIKNEDNKSTQAAKVWNLELIHARTLGSHLGPLRREEMLSLLLGSVHFQVADFTE